VDPRPGKALFAAQKRKDDARERATLQTG
jgi:hypothetical protein